jgi:hypothetical protein
MHYYTRGEFATALLRAIDAPNSRRNRRALLAWMQAEGDAGRFNPLNTTHDWPGATDFNWVGVKNYASFEDGVRATAATLNYGADRGLYGYRPIRARLRASRPSWRVLKAVEESQWGTGGLALRVLRSVPVLAAAYAHHRLAQ